MCCNKQYLTEELKLNVIIKNHDAIIHGLVTTAVAVGD